MYFPIPASLRVSAALATLFVASSLQADPPRRHVGTSQPAVHQMEIFNGPTRTVRNFGFGLSTSEAATLRELDRLENESAFSHDLLALQRQYVASERMLEPHRHLVQRDLYGRSITTSNYGNLTSGFGSGYDIGGFGYGYYRPAVYSAGSAGGQTTVVNSLADGVGPASVLETSLASVIARQAVPGHAEAVTEKTRRAMAAAAVSPVLRAGLGFQTPEEMRKQDNAIRAVGYETPVANRITLTLANGQKVIGTNLQESKEWLSLDRADGGTSRYRLSQVVQIDLPSAGAKAAPAADR